MALLAPVVARFGFGGLLLAGFMAGVLLVAMGLARMGRLIAFVPHPVTTGFTAGIAVVIATLQLKDFFGLSLPHAPESYVERWQMLWSARHTASVWEALWRPPRWASGVGPADQQEPAGPLIALAVVALLAAGLEQLVPGFEVATIASRFRTELGGEVFAGIPPVPPHASPSVGLARAGRRAPRPELFDRSGLLPAAFAIAMLGAIESLLAAVIADGMAARATIQTPSSSRSASATCSAPSSAASPPRAPWRAPPPTSAPGRARRSPRFFTRCSSWRAGRPRARGEPAAHGCPGCAAPGGRQEHGRGRHFVHLVRVAPRSDVLVLLVCFVLTVFFDMVVAVASAWFWLRCSS